jgi:hypothetical protein
VPQSSDVKDLEPNYWDACSSLYYYPGLCATNSCKIPTRRCKFIAPSVGVGAVRPTVARTSSQHLFVRLRSCHSLGRADGRLPAETHRRARDVDGLWCERPTHDSASLKPSFFGPRIEGLQTDLLYQDYKTFHRLVSE